MVAWEPSRPHIVSFDGLKLLYHFSQKPIDVIEQFLPLFFCLFSFSFHDGEAYLLAAIFGISWNRWHGGRPLRADQCGELLEADEGEERPCREDVFFEAGDRGIGQVSSDFSGSFVCSFTTP